MGMEEELLNIQNKIRDEVFVSRLLTEEATKNALVMPFITHVLGYNVFDPYEVVPEFTTDVGVKSSEKVDYAIFHGGNIQILIEVKQFNHNLSRRHANQLWRYFSATDARIGALTNGKIWEFYTDVEKVHIMDENPFLVIDLTDIKNLKELQKLSKQNFNLDSIIAAAEELKFTSAFQEKLQKEFEAPTAEMVKFLAREVVDGKLTSNRVESLKPLVKKAINQVIRERVMNRFNDLDGHAAPTDEVSLNKNDLQEPVITDDELQAFAFIQAMLEDNYGYERITSKLTPNHLGIRLDNNIRKTFVKLKFSDKSMNVQLLDPDTRDWKNEKIETIYDLFSMKDKILVSINVVENRAVYNANEKANSLCDEPSSNTPETEVKTSEKLMKSSNESFEDFIFATLCDNPIDYKLVISESESLKELTNTTGKETSGLNIVLLPENDNISVIVEGYNVGVLIAEDIKSKLFNLYENNNLLFHTSVGVLVNSDQGQILTFPGPTNKCIDNNEFYIRKRPFRVFKL